MTLAPYTLTEADLCNCGYPIDSCPHCEEAEHADLLFNMEREGSG